MNCVSPTYCPPTHPPPTLPGSDVIYKACIKYWQKYFYVGSPNMPVIDQVKPRQRGLTPVVGPLVNAPPFEVLTKT